MNLGRCHVIHENPDGSKRFVYLSPRKRRRTQRRDLRRRTEATARAWGVGFAPREFTRPLCKRLLTVIAGNLPPDVRTCFWYNPGNGGKFEGMQDPRAEAVCWQSPATAYDSLMDPDFDARISAPYREVIYEGKRWAYETRNGFRVSVWLYLPKDAPPRDYHQADVRQAMDLMLGAALSWCKATGLRPY